MKAVIVDDERHVRNLLHMAIDWEALGVERLLEAADGEEALRIVAAERPEIIVTDMRMPRRDGVSLLQALSEFAYPHRTIVVSGYDDFPYLKKTIEYGGFDYFIKPIDEEELTERLRAAIAELKREIAEERRTRENAMKLNEQRWTNRNRLLTQWLGQSGGWAGIRPFFREEIGWEEDAVCFLAQMRVDENWARIKRLFGERLDLLYFSLVNIADEVLQYPRHGLAFHDLSADGIVLLLIKTADSAEAERLCREIARTIGQSYGFRAEIAIAPAGAGPERAKEQRNAAEAIRLLRNLLAPAPDGLYRASDMASGSIVSLLDEERELKRLVAAAHRPAIGDAVREIMRPFRAAGAIQAKQLLWWEQELQWLATYFFAERDAAPGGSPSSPYGKLPGPDESGGFSLDELEHGLQEHLLSLAERLDDRRGQKKKETMYQVRDYLRSAYHRPLQIQELAEKFYLHPEYLARQFKQEFRIGIKDFLTELRIEHAKRLLANRNVTVGEIAGMVGFADEKYFSKVFKKATALSPQQYRNRSENG